MIMREISEGRPKMQAHEAKGRADIPAPKVSIVIINWNGLNYIIECLESLRRIDYTNYEIIVVDNASSDSSPEKIARLFPEVTLIRNKQNLGYSAGNNVGMKYALANGTSYIWLLNNDTVVEPNALMKLVACAEKEPKTGFLSPVLYDYSSKSQIQYCGSCFDWKNYSTRTFRNFDDAARMANEDAWLWSTALLLRREVIDAIGYMNEQYFLYFDDMEYSLRGLKAGFMCKIEPSARVYHKSHFREVGVEKKMPLHFFYYCTRNEYLFRMDTTPGFKKLDFLKKFLVKSLEKVDSYKKKSEDEIVDACLDGLYCGMRNIRGPWDKDIKMPLWLKKIILAHPYLLIDILRGDGKKIISVNFKRIKDKLRKQAR